MKFKKGTKLIPYFGEDYDPQEREYCPEGLRKQALKKFGPKGEWFNMYHSLLVVPTYSVVDNSIVYWTTVYVREIAKVISLREILRLPVLMSRVEWDQKSNTPAPPPLEELDDLRV